MGSQAQSFQAADRLSGDDPRQVCRVAGYAFILNLFLALMKGALAGVSGSLAITASAIDSGTDAVASLVIYAGVRLSTKKTRSFPLGLYKLENLASVMIAIFIFIAGYEIGVSIFAAERSRPEVSLLFIGLLCMATVLIWLFGRYAVAVGRKTGSPTLIAEGKHRQVDVLSSVVVVVSAVFSYFEVDWAVGGVTIDQIGACLILVFIARAGWDLLSDGMRVLLDASIDFSTLEQIRRILAGSPLVDEVTSVSGRNAGRFRFIYAAVTVNTQDLEIAHQTSEELEREIRRQIPHIEKVTLQYEPRQRTHDRIALPLSDPDGTLSAHFGEAPYFAIVQVRRKDGSIQDSRILENPYQDVDTAKGIRVAEWLIQQEISHVGMKEDVSHRGPGYVLASGGASVHQTACDRMPQAIQEITSALHG